MTAPTTPYPGQDVWPYKWQPCKVHGTFIGLDGIPLAGERVALSCPVEQIIVAGNDTIVLARTLYITLDDEGSFERWVPASEDLDIAPNGWQFSFIDPDGNLSHFTTPVYGDIDVSDYAQLADPGEPYTPSELEAAIQAEVARSNSAYALKSDVKTPTSYNAADYIAAAGAGAANDLGQLMTYMATNVATDGSTIVAPVQAWDVKTSIGNAGKSLNLDFSGCSMKLRPNLAAGADLAFIPLNLAGEFDTAQSVTAQGTTTVAIDGGAPQLVPMLTIAGTWPTPLNPGDIMKVVADETIPERRGNNGITEQRVGEFAVVLAATDNTVTISAPLFDTYATNVRIARLKPITVRVKGGDWDVDDSLMASFKRPLVYGRSMMMPKFDDMNMKRNSMRGIHLRSNYHPALRGIDSVYLLNQPTQDLQGTTVYDEANESLLWIGGESRNCRHAFSDDSPRVAVNSGVEGYGRPRNAVVANVQAFGSNSMGFNTHQTSYGAFFHGCVCANGAKSGFGGRGRSGSVVNCIGRNNAYGYFRLFTDTPEGGQTYGWRIVGAIKEGTTLDSQPEIAVLINDLSSQTYSKPNPNPPPTNLTGLVAVGTMGQKVPDQVNLTIDGGHFANVKWFIGSGTTFDGGGNPVRNGARNCIINLVNMPSIVVAATVPDGSSLFQLENSEVRGEWSENWRANTAGAGLLPHLMTGAGCLMQTTTVHIRDTADVNSRLASRWFVGASGNPPAYLRGIQFDYFGTLPAHELIVQGVAADVVSEWRSRNGAGGSFRVTRTDAGVSNDMTVTVLSRATDAQLTYNAILTSSTSRTLGKLDSGNHIGQTMVLMVTSASASRTVTLTSDVAGKNVLLPGGNAVVLSDAQSVVLVWRGDAWVLASGPITAANPQRYPLATGESVIARERIRNTNITLVSGTMTLVAFQAEKTEPAAAIRIIMGGTAGASNTLAVLGYYTLNPTGGGTLTASTAHDAALFTGASGTRNTKALQAATSKVLSRWYAIGFLAAGGTMPQLSGDSGLVNAAETFEIPWACARTGAGALSALPASFVIGDLSSYNAQPYAAVLPA